ncbi:MAG: hypothetical protein KIS86_10615 [Devosia sp.]|nr:hypothetical protein [Devosia sp.]
MDFDGAEDGTQVALAQPDIAGRKFRRVRLVEAAILFFLMQAFVGIIGLLSQTSAPGVDGARASRRSTPPRRRPGFVLF